jgi:hypothetical protein
VARFLALVLIASLELLAGAPAAAQGSGGRIEGTVTLSRVLAARRPRFRIYADAGKGATPPSQPAPDLSAEFANVVIYLEGGTLPPSRPPALSPSMTQKDERFIPHVLPILRGATVNFPNEDEIYHNVFSLSSPRPFDLPKYPAGASRSVTFSRPGVVNVFCHIHADMSAVILVMDNPFFTSPTTDGRFALGDLPPGEYTLVAWHERIKPVRQKVRIVAGEVTTVSFNIPLPSPER